MRHIFNDKYSVSNEEAYNLSTSKQFLTEEITRANLATLLLCDLLNTILYFKKKVVCAHKSHTSNCNSQSQEEYKCVGVFFQPLFVLEVGHDS